MAFFPPFHRGLGLMLRSFFLILGLLILQVRVEAAFKPPKRRDQHDRPTYTAKDDQVDQLPDFGDPKVNRELRCSSCNALVSEIYKELITLHKRKDGRQKSYEVAEVLEDTCQILRDEYGILLKNNKPTNTFSRNKAITRMTGAWINSFIETRCGELMDEHEDALLSEYKSAESVEAMRRIICVERERTCDEDQIIDEF